MEMVYRFWIAVIGGAYATHGETKPEDMGDGWISTGGTLERESPARIAFLKQILDLSPIPALDPIDQYYETNVAGKAGEYYLIYFGKEPIEEWPSCCPTTNWNPACASEST